MLLGLRTVIYHVSDAAEAARWYSRVLGIEPYFNEPFYVGFNVGGFELGLDPDSANVTVGDSSVAYWGVEDAHAAHRRLLELGATNHGDVHEVGGGILVGSVRDPWGNVLGVIRNPHFRREDVR
jgi:predicted enzyme related to lactoylglutathione lyase